MSRVFYVLLIEDDPTTVFAVTAALSEAGHVVSCATSVSEAVAAVSKAHTFDVALLDLGLDPDRGEDIFFELRRRGICCAPVVILSARTQIDIERAAASIPVSAWLRKPVSITAVCAATERATGKRQSGRLATTADATLSCKRFCSGVRRDGIVNAMRIEPQQRINRRAGLSKFLLRRYPRLRTPAHLQGDSCGVQSQIAWIPYFYPWEAQRLKGPCSVSVNTRSAPRADSPAQDHAPAATPPVGAGQNPPNIATLHSATILIVDDQAMDRLLLSTLLTREGYIAVSASTGEEALAQIALMRPDLIIVDYAMPGMDGSLIVRALKLDPATLNIPVIMVTGRDDRSARLAGLLAGAEEFLAKPVDRTELALRVRNLLRLKAHSDFVKNHSAILEEEVKARTADLVQFRMALDTAGDAIILVNRTTMQFVEANTTACVMLGYAREELLSIGPVQTATVTIEQMERVYDAVIARHPSDELAEVQLLRKDGSHLLVEARRQAYRSGADWLIVSVLRDITERKRAEFALKLAESSVNNASAATYWIASDGRILRVNRAACDQLGYSETELLDLSLTDINPGLTSGQWRTHWDELRERKRMTFESRHKRKDGHIFPVEVDLNWFEFEGREYNFAFARDITDRKRAAHQIAHLNRVYAVLSQINALTVQVATRDELFKEACRIAVDVGGFSAALMGVIEPGGASIVPVALASADAKFQRAIEDILTSRHGAPTSMAAQAIEEKKAVFANHLQSGSHVLFGPEYAEFGVRSIVLLPLIITGQVIGILGLYARGDDFFHQEEMKLLNQLANDIASAFDHIQKSERLTYLAYYDVLTGLANRTLFLERLTQLTRAANSASPRFAVALIDLERFKNINDSVGQAAGDAVLKDVADWLTVNSGAHSQVARIDADHFAFILPAMADEHDLVGQMEEKQRAFRHHAFQIGESSFHIAFKAGAAIFPDDSIDAEALLQKAEAALKNAKASGEPFRPYTKKMSDALANVVKLESRLREALSKNEFVLHYQPKVNLTNGQITGAEALIRWNDPRTGLILPTHFISILEETGLIHEVGRWALRQAIADHLRWLHSGMAAVRIAVNVSPLQLRHRNFLDEVNQQLQVDVHASSGLELEVTESLIMDDVEYTIEVLNAIRNMGVAIAIDDFGTGFSSLSYLSQLPVDTLKIDRSFIAAMSAGPSGLSLVSTIINLAHSMKLNVVAEGVETEEQSRLLRLLNCDEMQGYVFCKAVPVEEFERRFLVPQNQSEISP